jgi:hypothetical protein
MTSSAAAYPIALSHPFEPEAEGAQVPDLYTFPTQTSMLRTQFTLIAPPSSNGNVDFVVQPNLFCTVAASAPYSAGGSFNPIQGGVPWTQSVVTQVGQNQFWEAGMVSVSQLAAQYARYRLVGWGVRVRSLIPPLNQQGTIVCTKVPSLSHWMNLQYGNTGPPVVYGPTLGVVQYQTGYSASAVTGSGSPCISWPQYLDYYELPGVDASGYITESVLGMPNSHQTSLAGMSLDNGLEVVGKVSSPAAFQWRDASNDPGNFNIANQQGLYPVCIGGQMLVQVNAGVQATDTQIYDDQIVGINDEDFIHQGGWSVLCFRASGLAQSDSQNTPQFTIEVVMHIEGVPFCQSSTVLSGAKYPIYAPHLLEMSLDHASRLPTYRKAVTPTNHNGGLKPHLEHLANSAAHHVAKYYGYSSPQQALSSLALQGGKYLAESAGLALL